MSLTIVTLHQSKYIIFRCRTPLLNNRLDSSNIATRVKAKNEKACKNTVHKKSQHFKARNLGNTSSSEPLSYEY